MSLKYQYALPPSAVRALIGSKVVHAARPEAAMPLFRLSPFQDDRLYGAAEDGGVWLLKKTVFTLTMPLWYFRGALTAAPGGTVIEGRFRLSPERLAIHLGTHLAVLLAITLIAAGDTPASGLLMLDGALVLVFAVYDLVCCLIQLGSIRYVKRFLEKLA